MCKPGEPSAKCSEHLLYEIEMFYGLGKQLVEKPKGDWILDNALLEAFLVHARLLYYFFCEKPGRDDIGIKKHFDLDLCQSPSQQEKKWKRDISKRVVHLTERRVKVGISDEGWPIDEIVRTIGARIDKFAREDVRKKVCDDFEVRVEQCIESYRKLDNAQSRISPAALSTTDERPPSITELKAIPTPRQDE